MIYSWKDILWEVVKGIGKALIVLFIFFPIFWLCLTAFKVARDAYSTKIIFQPTFDNFIHIFSAPYNFGPLVINSLVVSSLTIAIAIPIATLTAYALSRYPLKGKNVLLVWILSSQFVPPVVVVLPFYGLFRSLQLLDTRTALVILNLSFVLSFAIWMVKGFIDALPAEIEEAAVVDGCNQFQVLLRVTLPLIMPGIITAAVFCFIQSWNEFLFALIITEKHATTLQVGLMSLFGDRGIIWEAMAAAGLIIMIPIFVLSITIRKHFIQGLTMGAGK
ncbi:MAG: ABC transporter permease [Deltaproteobacteria bacterium RBG_16_47_11]|nr:MAG: ABC transporter permease [Deltaproteobacteria bacterium RBG_16_47_11]